MYLNVFFFHLSLKWAECVTVQLYCVDPVFSFSRFLSFFRKDKVVQKEDTNLLQISYCSWSTYDQVHTFLSHLCLISCFECWICIECTCVNQTNPGQVTIASAQERPPFIPNSDWKNEEIIHMSSTIMAATCILSSPAAYTKLHAIFFLYCINQLK